MTRVPSKYIHLHYPPQQYWIDDGDGDDGQEETNEVDRRKALMHGEHAPVDDEKATEAKQQERDEVEDNYQTVEPVTKRAL